MYTNTTAALTKHSFTADIVSCLAKSQQIATQIEKLYNSHVQRIIVFFSLF